jgi:transposase InsO family protein
VDFTKIGGLFRSVVVATVIDAFSRKVLALRVSPDEPDAAFALRLLREAIDRHGKPTWVVSDKGTQFTAHRFGGYLRRRKIRRRFAAPGESNLSRIDRFWRTMKEEFAHGLLLFRPIRSVERDLRGYAQWHGRERPHEGLRLQTPDEVFFARKPRKLRCVEEGRLAVAFVDRDRRLPVFRLRRAG